MRKDASFSNAIYVSLESEEVSSMIGSNGFEDPDVMVLLELKCISEYDVFLGSRKVRSCTFLVGIPFCACF
jgi:hypothetical protein